MWMLQGFFLWRCSGSWVWMQVGEDAFMETQGAVIELTGHTDTLSSLAFSADGSMLASGGMDGGSIHACVQALRASHAVVLMWTHERWLNPPAAWFTSQVV